MLGGNIAPVNFVISLESINDRSSGNFSAKTITLTSEVAILNSMYLVYHMDITGTAQYMQTDVVVHLFQTSQH